MSGSSNFEQDPTGIRCGIKIRNLTKVYKVRMYVCTYVRMYVCTYGDNCHIHI